MTSTTFEALRGKPAPKQQTFLDSVASIYLNHGEWPSWAWVDETLDNLGVDALAVLSGLPRET